MNTAVDGLFGCTGVKEVLSDSACPQIISGFLHSLLTHNAVLTANAVQHVVTALGRLLWPLVLCLSAGIVELNFGSKTSCGAHDR
jgi:hypothetical protein